MAARSSTHDERDLVGGRRPTVRAFVTWLTVGLLLGALVGALLTVSRPRTYAAEAIVGITPSSAILGAGDGVENLEAFIQSELIFFNGPQLRARVAELAGGETGGFSAAQVGNTSAVTVTAVASTAEQALETAALAVQLYTEGREDRLRREIAKAAQTVDAELTRIERSLGTGVAGASALQGEYGRLLAVRSGLFRAEANVDTAVTVIQPAVDASEGRLTRLLRSILIGGLLGALAAVTALTIHRRLSRRVRVEGDLDNVGLRVLRPTLPRFRGQFGPLSADERLARPARLLSAQLVPSVDEPPVIVLCGPNRHAGATWTAIALAASLVERSTVLLLLLCDVTESKRSRMPEWLVEAQHADLGAPGLTPESIVQGARRTAVPGLHVVFIGNVVLGQRLLGQGLLQVARSRGYTVVVDAPALSESSVALEIGARADAFAMVVGLGITSLDDVEVANDLLRHRGIQLSGVVLDRPLRRRRASPLEHLRREGDHHDGMLTGTPERPGGAAVPDAGTRGAAPGEQITTPEASRAGGAPQSGQAESGRPPDAVAGGRDDDWLPLLDPASPGTAPRGQSAGAESAAILPDRPLEGERPADAGGGSASELDETKKDGSPGPSGVSSQTRRDERSGFPSGWTG